MPRPSQRKGCLATILALFGIDIGGPARQVDLPYRQRDDFLSPAEFSFYRVLVAAVGNQAVVCPKVNLSDIFYVARRNENRGYQSRIDRKHVDFLVCDRATMKPCLGIELDDASHRRRDRQERDEFVGQVFEAAGLRLVRVPAQATYNVAELRSQLALGRLGQSAAASVPPATPVAAPGPPICPKCGIPMVLRTASKGSQAGQPFFGCENYPKCRETKAAER